jgi:hypothetical protein
MGNTFNPRDIPHRAHYDRLMTWATGVLGKLDGDDMSDLQVELHEAVEKALATDDDDAKIVGVLAELGFCAVIDNMAEIIEQGDNS